MAWLFGPQLPADSFVKAFLLYDRQNSVSFKHEESKYVKYVNGAGRTDISKIAIPKRFICKVRLDPSVEEI